MIDIEALNSPLDVRNFTGDDSRILVKLGLGAMILDPDNRMLVLEHEAQDNNYDQFALGAVMETLRFVPSRGKFATETPLEAMLRSLLEELRMGPNKILAAGLFAARDSFIYQGEWALGTNDDGVDMYVAGIGLMIRTTHTEPFHMEQPTEEVIQTKFMELDEVRSSDNLRPGFASWLDEVAEKLDFTKSPSQICPILPIALPKIGADVRY